jgi:hypothetical protein
MWDFLGKFEGEAQRGARQWPVGDRRWKSGLLAQRGKGADRAPLPPTAHFALSLHLI